MSTRHPNTNTQWTTEEVVKVISLRKAEMRFSDIAKELGRTPAAVSTKYFELKRKQPWLFKPDKVDEPAPIAAPYPVTAMAVGAALFAAGLITGAYL